MLRDNSTMRVDTRTRYSPSDLTAFLACPHLTTLRARGRARGARAAVPATTRTPTSFGARATSTRPPTSPRSATTVVADRGSARDRLGRAAAATEQAMRDGAPIVYQAAFVDGGWRGLADFLERQPDGGYEVVDTKLARRAKAGARAPALLLHRAGRADSGALAGGDARRQRARRARELPAGRLRRLLPAAAGAVPRRGRERRSRPTRTRSTTARSASSSRSARSSGSDDDHLSLVAGIRRVAGRAAHRRRDHDARRRSRRPPETKIPKLRAADASRSSATRPSSSSTTGRPASSSTIVLPLEPERGFALLPEPSPGDIWLDLEGDPWFEPERGLEYLFGWVYLDDDGEPRYDCIWALDRAEEKAGFERLLDLIVERRAPLPGHARLPLRALRAHGAAAADGRARHARGRARRPAARRGARRPLPRRPPGAAALARRATRSRRSRSSTASSAGRRCAAGAARSSPSRSGSRRGEDVDPRGDPRLQRGRLPLALRAAPLAARPAPGGGRVAAAARGARGQGGDEGAARGARAGRGGAARGRGGGRAALAARAPARVPPARGEAAVVGVLPPPRRSTRRSCSRTPTRSAGSSSSASRVEDRQSFAYTFSFPPQEHKIGGECVDPATEKALRRRGRRRARPRPAAPRRGSARTSRCRAR